MRNRYLLLMGTLALLVILGSIFIMNQWKNQDNKEGSMPPGQSSNQPPENTSRDNVNIDPLRAQIKAMSLEEKIGQLVMVGVDGYENDSNSQQLITKYHVGGFVLLQQNIKDANQMLSLINSLKETNAKNKIPLFLSIDEEGGRISRMPNEFIKLPSNQRIGELNYSKVSSQIGGIIGEELRMFGLNMNFAPVLDINSNPKNVVIGDRSFGNDPGLVSKLGIETMKGLQSENIISVVKHFPGHGDTSVDSHVGLPTVNHDLSRLKSLELVPFSSAIDNSVDAIMMAHILLPKIDSVYPASFSQIVISDVLRKDMNFDGIVITDDMTMGAIVKNYDIGEAAVKSIKAGSDVILVCHDFAKEEAVLKTIQKAAQSGSISLDRIDQSVYRILKLKKKYAISDKIVEAVNPQRINNKTEKLYKDFPSLK